MIDALVQGKIYGKPAERKAKTGKMFYVAKVRVATDQDPLFVNVICFEESTGEALLVLQDGDPVSLAGSISPKVWLASTGEHRPVLDMVAHVITTPYHVKRKREKMTYTKETDGKRGMEAARSLFGDD